VPDVEFDPSSDGFGFANDWTLSPGERDELRTRLAASVERAIRMLTPAFPGALVLLAVAPRLGRVLTRGLPDTYGLCGGMAFAALDFHHHAGAEALSTEYPVRPPVGSPLYVYLWRRLIDSLTLNGHLFLAWFAMLHLVPGPLGGGPAWLLRRTREQVVDLCRRLEEEGPIPIGLIGQTPDLFNDHQVLAYSCDASTPDRPLIRVYDSNCPGTSSTIRLDLSGPVLGAEESCRGMRGDLRGLFCESYADAVPPRP
jgi:hypothetical protein